MRVTQPAWRQEVLSDATRVRIANNYASIGHAVSSLPSIANLRSARSSRPDALYLHVAGQENVCIECSDIQIQGFLRGYVGWPAAAREELQKHCSGIAQVNIIARPRFTRRSAVRVLRCSKECAT